MSVDVAGRPHFEAQMRELEHAALGALDMAVAQLDRALDAVERSDAGLAEFVAHDDDRIDGRYLEVHQGVLSLLALQAPVASDLRLVAAVLHAINSIERIGDQCVNIAKLVPLAERGPAAAPELWERLREMGAAVREEVVLARRAFTDHDVALAETIPVRDREVDRFDREIFHLAVAAGEDPRARTWAMTTTLVARALERIGGNACEIARQAMFVETGQIPEAPLPAASIEDA